MTSILVLAIWRQNHYFQRLINKIVESMRIEPTCPPLRYLQTYSIYSKYGV